jgi:hypothetical protein
MKFRAFPLLMKLNCPIAISVSACNGVCATPMIDERVVAEVFRLPERMEIVLVAAKAEVCLLRVQNASGSVAPVYEEQRYLDLNAATRDAITECLLSKATYTWGVSSTCLPTFNGRIRFVHEQHTLWVDFCFECSMMRLSYDGVAYSGALIHAANYRIYRVFLSLFPSEASLQRLKPLLERRQKQAQQEPKR